jgi:transcriptional regulator with XRE-family HTH domain
MPSVDFITLQLRLVERLRETVKSGRATERGLARLTGVSQPHLHHVLRGKRSLSFDMADQILNGLRIDVLDLIEGSEFAQRRR